MLLLMLFIWLVFGSECTHKALFPPLKPQDFATGKRHNLEFRNLFTDEGKEGGGFNLAFTSVRKGWMARLILEKYTYFFRNEVKP